MITGIASCPNPPLLIPGATGGRVAEVEQLRSAGVAAVLALLAQQPNQVVVVGSSFTFAGKPLAQTVADALLRHAQCQAPVEHLLVAEDATVDQCLATGRALAGRPGRLALLVMADGSARRSVKAPGYLDERAAGFDTLISDALAAGDPDRLAALDPSLADELMAAGRAAWQVLAGAATGQPWQAELRYSDDPFGVWYPVASWQPGS